MRPSAADPVIRAAAALVAAMSALVLASGCAGAPLLGIAVSARPSLLTYGEVGKGLLASVLLIAASTVVGVIGLVATGALLRRAWWGWFLAMALAVVWIPAGCGVPSLALVAILAQPSVRRALLEVPP